MPGVNDLLELRVHLVVREQSESGRRAHWPVEDGFDGCGEMQAPLAGLGARASSGSLEPTIAPMRQSPAPPWNIESRIAHLRSRIWVAIDIIWRLRGDLLEHLLKAHVNRGITLDQFLQFLNCGVKRGGASRESCSTFSMRSSSHRSMIRRSLQRTPFCCDDLVGHNDGIGTMSRRWEILPHGVCRSGSDGRCVALACSCE